MLKFHISEALELADKNPQNEWLTWVLGMTDGKPIWAGIWKAVLILNIFCKIILKANKIPVTH